MKESDYIDNKNVVIAANHYLFRLGIRTLINVIGIDPYIKELSSMQQVLHLTKEYRDLYLIIEQELFEQKEFGLIPEIQGYGSGIKILVIGNREIKHMKNVSFLNIKERHQYTLKRFQDFFFKEEKEEKKQENIKSHSLSDREIEILKVVAKGLANKEIADQLNISINTVITHRKNITDKLGIKTIAGLTVFAVMNNLIDPDEVTR